MYYLFLCYIFIQQLETTMFLLPRPTLRGEFREDNMTALSICFQQRTNQKLVLSSHEEAGEMISAELVAEMISAELVAEIISGEKGLVMKNELKTLAKLCLFYVNLCMVYQPNELKNICSHVRAIS